MIRSNLEDDDSVYPAVANNLFDSSIPSCNARQNEITVFLLGTYSSSPRILEKSLLSIFACLYTSESFSPFSSISRSNISENDSSLFSRNLSNLALLLSLHRNSGIFIDTDSLGSVCLGSAANISSSGGISFADSISHSSKFSISSDLAHFSTTLSDIFCAMYKLIFFRISSSFL